MMSEIILIIDINTVHSKTKISLKHAATCKLLLSSRQLIKQVHYCPLSLYNINILPFSSSCSTLKHLSTSRYWFCPGWTSNPNLFSLQLQTHGGNLRASGWRLIRVVLVKCILACMPDFAELPLSRITHISTLKQRGETQAAQGGWTCQSQERALFDPQESPFWKHVLSKFQHRVFFSGENTGWLLPSFIVFYMFRFFFKSRFPLNLSSGPSLCHVHTFFDLLSKYQWALLPVTKLSVWFVTAKSDQNNCINKCPEAPSLSGFTDTMWYLYQITVMRWQIISLFNLVDCAWTRATVTWTLSEPFRRRWSLSFWQRLLDLAKFKG